MAHDSQSGAPSLGETLRSAREAKGYSFDRMAGILRIRKRHLEALEEDRFTDLPPRPYVEIFLTSYAKTVGLPPREVLERFFAETGEQPPRTAKLWEEGDEEVPDRRPRRGVWVFVAGAVVILAAAAAYFLLRQG